jgi:hypothetical protein
MPKLPAILKAELTCDVALLAAVEGDAGPRKFKIEPAYSGGAVNLNGWPLPLVVDLATLTVGKRVSANLDHERKQRVGHVTESHNDGKTVSLDGVVSGASAAANQFLESSDAGFPWGASIEVAFKPANVAELRKGEQQVVNGRTIKGPALVGRKGVLFGVAMSDSPADDSTVVTIAATAAKHKELSMEFAQWLENLGLDADTLSEGAVAKLTAKYEAEQAGGESNLTLEEVLANRKAEDARQSKIAKLTDEALAEFPGKSVEIEAIARLAISQNWEPSKYELEILRAGRIQNKQFKVAGGRRGADAKVITAALCMSAGMPELEKHFKPEVLEAVDAAGLRTIGLQEVILMAANENGYVARPGERILAGNLKTILEHAMPPAVVARMAGFSTVSLPTILGAVANKEIMQGYGEDDNMTWKEIATIKSSRNFLTYNCYRMTDDLEFEPLGPTGEIRHGKLTQEGYTRKVNTYAKMLGLSREQILNDDTGAFDDLRRLIGLAGYRKFRNLFWKTFLAAKATFFTTARGNYIEGATTNLGADGVGLTALELKFRQMKSSTDDGAKRITGRPSILVHPPELSSIARRHFISAGVNTGGAATAEAVPNGNVFAGLYRPVTVDELSDTSLHSAASATGWGLFRAPSILAPMVVSYLNGNPNPTVESAEADFSQPGIQFRGIFDVGCDVAEYLAGAWSKGAA